MQEYCVVDLERIDVPEIDGALLMELLEDSCADADADAEDDRLGGVIRSLEAEIGSNSGSMEIGDDESTTGPADGGLEAVLSDFDSFDGLRDAGYAVEEDPFGWAEMEVGTSAAMGGWYVGVEEGEGGVVEYEEEGREFDYGYGYGYGVVYYGEGMVEQTYSPLWG
ncbi:hypothetical protein ACMD2_27347 [Ananas comosus]|uniref:Uncharacterized protein n=1 Tax=Ananas comosus TaxID=4615 RepID=A0A199UWB5_ANACO|nr:hypothetical protein ACMD2_27347 [Ananas comosus]